MSVKRNYRVVDLVSHGSHYTVAIERDCRGPANGEDAVRETTPSTNGLERPFAVDRTPCGSCWGWPCICARLAEDRQVRRAARRGRLRRILRQIWRDR